MEPQKKLKQSAANEEEREEFLLELIAEAEEAE